MSKRTPKFNRNARKPHLWKLQQVDGQADVIIGDTSFRPRVRSTKWGGRCWMEVSATDCTTDIAEETEKVGVLESSMVRSSRGLGQGRDGIRSGELHRWYIGNSLDWDIVWHSPRDLPEDTDAEGNRVIFFDLDMPEGLIYANQPELTQAEIDSGCFRPDNLINSYVFQWNLSGRYCDNFGSELVNYETGKYGTLHRPVCICADGSRFWASQEIIPNRLKVTLPKDYVNSLGAAQYPLTLDPTFGYTSVGGTNYQWSTAATARGSKSSAQHHTAISGDTITSFSVYADQDSVTNVQFNMAAYTVVSGTPSSRLASQVSITVVPGNPAQWYNTSTVSQALSAGSTYCVACNTSVQFFKGRAFYDSIGSTSYETSGLVSSWSENGTESRTYSLYATYTAGTPTVSKFKRVNIF